MVIITKDTFSWADGSWGILSESCIDLFSTDSIFQLPKIATLIVF